MKRNSPVVIDYITDSTIVYHLKGVYFAARRFGRSFETFDVCRPESHISVADFLATYDAEKHVRVESLACPELKALLEIQAHALTDNVVPQ